MDGWMGHYAARITSARCRNICCAVFGHLPEDHKSYASEQTEDQSPVWRECDVVAVLAHSKLDEVRRRQGHK